jgi:competence ComEA-like helix-hairpin-helix protein
MVPFKPSEIRIIAALSLLALLGSALTIIQRQGKASRLDISVFSEKSNYKYTYQPAKGSGQKDDVLSATLAAQAQIPEASSAIDINGAGLYDFEALPGIGPAIAQSIVAHRDSIGRFAKIEDLLNVRGIGPAKFAAIKHRVFVK